MRPGFEPPHPMLRHPPFPHPYADWEREGPRDAPHSRPHRARTGAVERPRDDRARL